MKKPWVWWLALTLALAAAVLAWVSQPPLIDALPLRPAALLRTLQFSARVGTLSRVDVGSTLTARVDQVLAVEAARVPAGAVLIRLESDELRGALAQAEAAQQQAQARLAGLRGSGRLAVAAALQQAQATFKAAQAELRRSEQLVAQGFVSGSRLDEATRAAEVARALQDSAQAQLQANSEAGTELLQAQAQLALAQAALQTARARLEQTVLRAPAAALVLTRLVEPGQIVQPGRALMTLALDGPTQLLAQVDERFLDQLAPGQRASVLADAFAAQPFAAQVLSIAPLVDAQRGAVEVKLAPQPPLPNFLRQDMTLSVEVETGRRASALVLPTAALRAPAAAGDGSAEVWLAVDGRAQLRQVTLGLRTLDAVEVLHGLQDGDLVLLPGALALSAGSAVRTRSVSFTPGTAAASAVTRIDGASALTSSFGR